MMSLESNTPFAKLSRCLVMDTYSTNAPAVGPTRDLVQPMTQNISRAPNESTAAMI